MDCWDAEGYYGISVLIPFLAGLWFGPAPGGPLRGVRGLNPLFGGSVVWTGVQPGGPHPAQVLIPFLAGLWFGRIDELKGLRRNVLIPFLAGLWFGLPTLQYRSSKRRLNPLFGGSVVWTGTRLIYTPI